MSYDVSIGDYWSNYTSNLSEMFYTHIEGGIPGLQGMTGNQAYMQVMDGLMSIRNECQDRPNGPAAWEHMSEKYDPENKWGDVLAATLWLVELAHECKKRPRSRVEVCYW